MCATSAPLVKILLPKPVHVIPLLVDVAIEFVPSPTATHIPFPYATLLPLPEPPLKILEFLLVHVFPSVDVAILLPLC